MIVTEEDGKGYLKQYVQIVEECIGCGFGRYFKLPPKARVDFSPRSRASIIHDFIKAEARKQFLDMPKIQIYEIRGLFLVDFGEIQLRFKKLNRRLLPQNIPTEQTLAFMRQETLNGQKVLPGFTIPTKVVAGYQPDASFTNIKYMGILCYCGTDSEYLWKIDLAKSFTPPIPLHDAEPEEKKGTKEHITPKEGVKNGRKKAI